MTPTPPPRLYLDECVNHKVVPYLRGRGVPVTTTRDEGMAGEDDDVQLRFAQAKGWIILTNNKGHFVRLHHTFLARGEPHSGILSVPQDDVMPQRFFVRTAMIFAWIQREHAETANTLFRWNDLQQRLQQSHRLAGFDDADVALALGFA